jgi:type I restriction enzyme S subunit
MKRYDSYKDSGIEWIGEIPNHWEFLNLKYILKENVRDGPHETPIWFEEGIPFLSIDGIVNGEISFDGCRFIDEVQYEKFSKKLIIELNDIFIGKAASIGKIARVKTNRKFTVWSPIAVVKVKSDFNPTFVEYYFKSDVIQHQIEMFSTSNTQKNIAMGDIPKMKFISPPFNEQTVIANYLDQKTAQIDDLIAKKERLIQLLEEERTAIINQAVTKGLDPTVPMKDSGIEWLGEIPAHWSRARVKTLVKIKVCDGPHETPDWKEDGIPFISAEAIKGNQIDLNFKRGYISKEQHLEYCKKSKVLKGDILFCKSGSTTGKSALVEIDDEFGIWSPLAIIRTDERKISNRYMFQSIQSSLFRNQVETSWTFGTQPNIGMGALENLWIAVPPKNEQESIDKHLNSVLKNFDVVTTKTLQEIELLKEYKTALISEVVTGKVDVRCEKLN